MIVLTRISAAWLVVKAPLIATHGSELEACLLMSTHPSRSNVDIHGLLDDNPELAYRTVPHNCRNPTCTMEISQGILGKACGYCT